MEHIENTAAFMDEYRLLLEQGDELPLPVLGDSMAPFLIDRRDMVWLRAPQRTLKVGDMVLYQRSSGAYILHRICAADDGVYTLIGDAHVVREPNIRAEQIFGVVVRARRKDAIQRPGRFWWEFFARVWPRVIPHRPALLRFYSRITKPFRRTL